MSGVIVNRPYRERDREHKHLSPNYRLPENPKLRIFDVLETAWVMWGDNGRFMAKDIAEVFKITIIDACVRLWKLRKWDCVEVIPRTRPMKYRLTRWGKVLAKGEGKKKRWRRT